ncbi:MAG: hypothetical protein U0521_29265 [Anaerolineae bacterium]
MLNNHMLIQQQQKLNKIENDIQIARRIQQNFLPNTLPEVKGWEIGGRFSQRAKSRAILRLLPDDGRPSAGHHHRRRLRQGRRRGAVHVADAQPAAPSP